MHGTNWDAVVTMPIQQMCPVGPDARDRVAGNTTEILPKTGEQNALTTEVVTLITSLSRQFFIFIWAVSDFYHDSLG